MTRRLAAVLLIAALSLIGCTGVPTSSSPEIVKPVGVAQSAAPAATPAADADPRTIVLGFLAANAQANGHSAASRNFLTTDAKNRWSNTTVNVVDSLQVSNMTGGVVTVRGRDMGSVNASGIYTPALQGDGRGGVSVSFPFSMKQVGDQWRISKLGSGLILSYSEFQRIYHQRKIYFYDTAERYVVPDSRYSSLTDPSLLADWLVSQMADGPRPEIQNAVSREFPAQIDPRRVTVTLGPPAAVEVPGSSQLGASTRDRLAGQLALTLEQVTPGLAISILDGTQPITVSAAGETAFTASLFASALSPANPAPALFYIRDGAVVDAKGRRLPGQLGSPAAHLRSIALAGTSGNRDLRAAGTSGAPADARLLVGTEREGLRPTTLHGALSRPSWAPNLDEVWVGDGSQVYRFADGKAGQVPVGGASTLTGAVRSVQFSPEGSRVALVLDALDGRSSQIYIGSVVRTSALVRIDSLEPISPQGIDVVDVAWNDELKLFAIGKVRNTGESNVYEVQVDGSLWTSRTGSEDLPGAPDSITVAQGVPAWVSVGGTVWAQTGGSWASPNGGTSGCTNPTYLE
jgi:hypothetical protein